MNNLSFFKALLMKEMDEELKGGQKKLDVAKPKGKITKADFEKLRSMKEGGDQTPKHKIIAQLMGPDFFLSQKPESQWDEKDHDLFNRLSKMAQEKGKVPKLKEVGDHEVGMAHNSLESIIKSAMELKMKLGNDERDIPGWIQDHITNAENYIDQAAQGFHELHGGEHDMDELPDGTEEDYIQEGISIDIPEDTDYKEFAMAVANILKNDYGTHNYEPFISALSSELSKEEEPVEELSLESMMEDLFEAKKKRK